MKPTRKTNWKKICKDIAITTIKAALIVVGFIAVIVVVVASSAPF